MQDKDASVSFELPFFTLFSRFVEAIKTGLIARAPPIHGESPCTDIMTLKSLK